MNIIHPPEFEAPVPRAILRPCDWGLKMAVTNLEVQLGSIEAYNRLVGACERLKAQIDAGEAKDQHEAFRTSIRG